MKPFRGVVSRRLRLSLGVPVAVAFVVPAAGVWSLAHRPPSTSAQRMSAEQALAGSRALAPLLSPALANGTITAEATVRDVPGRADGLDWWVSAAAADGSAEAWFVWRTDTQRLVSASVVRFDLAGRARSGKPLGQGEAVEAGWRWLTTLGVVGPGERWELQGRPRKVGPAWRVVWSAGRRGALASVDDHDGSLQVGYTTDLFTVPPKRL